MINHLLIVAILVSLAPNSAAAALTYPVYAGPPQGLPPCDGSNGPSVGTIEVALGAAVFYVDDRNPVLGVWLYQESNGVYHDARYGDLQPGGKSVLLGGLDNDPCTGAPPSGPDALIL